MEFYSALCLCWGSPSTWKVSISPHQGNTDATKSAQTLTPQEGQEFLVEFSLNTVHAHLTALITLPWAYMLLSSVDCEFHLHLTHAYIFNS